MNQQQKAYKTTLKRHGKDKVREWNSKGGKKGKSWWGDDTASEMAKKRWAKYRAQKEANNEPVEL